MLFVFSFGEIYYLIGYLHNKFVPISRKTVTIVYNQFRHSPIKPCPNSSRYCEKVIYLRLRQQVLGQREYVRSIRKR